MAGNTLNAGSTLQCPHGGSVSIASTNTRVKADGAYVVTMGDTFTVSGCAFTLPGPKPSPCVIVRWVSVDTRVRVNSTFTLSRSSVGICQAADQTPQGPVIIANTQVKASTQ